MLRDWVLKTSDAIFGPPSCGLIAGAMALLKKSKAPTNWTPGNPRKILVIRPGGIGDMILMLPAITSISKAFPGAAIDIVCEQRNLPVIDLFSLNARGIPYDRNPFSFLVHLARTRYDIAIDTEQFHHSSAVFAALSGAEARIGFNINPKRNGLYTHLIPYSPDGFEGSQFLRLLVPLGIKESSFHPAFLRPSNPERQLRPDLVAKLNEAKEGGRRLVLVHIGGSTERKRWPENKTASLIARLADQQESAVVVLGAKSDTRRAARIMALVGTRSNVVCNEGHLSLRDCAALISMCSLFVGPDSGLLHLAAACNVPTVAIFGPSDEKKWGYGGRGRHAVVRHEIPCAPCFMYGYGKPCRHYECIEGITVEDVARACNTVAASSA